MKTHWRLIWGIIFLLSAVLRVRFLFRGYKIVGTTDLIPVALLAILGLTLLFKQYKTSKTPEETEDETLGRSQMEIIATILSAEMIFSMPAWFANNYSAGIVSGNIRVIVDIAVNACLLFYVFALYRNKKVLNSLAYVIVAACLLWAAADGWKDGWIASVTDMMTAVYVIFYIKTPLTKKYFRLANYLVLPLTFLIPLALIFFVSSNGPGTTSSFRTAEAPLPIRRCNRYNDDYHKYVTSTLARQFNGGSAFVPVDPNENPIMLVAYGGEVKTAVLQDKEWGKVVPEQVVIEAKWGVSEERINELVKGINGTIVTSTYNNEFHIVLPCEQDIPESINKLKAHPEINFLSLTMRGDGLPLISISANKWTTDDEVDRFASEINGAIFGIGFNSQGLGNLPEVRFGRTKNLDDDYFDFANYYLISLPTSMDANNIRSAINYFKNFPEIKSAEPNKVEEVARHPVFD